MNRLITFVFVSVFLILKINHSKAQLEVVDTILMAFDNGVFWSASSELNPDIYADFGKYGSTNLSDDDPNTCWAEGSDTNGEYEYILFTIPVNLKEIRLKNGYQKNKDLFQANNRLRNVEFELYASNQIMGYVTESHNGFCLSEKLTSSITEIKDTSGYQNIELNFNWTDIIELMQQDITFDKDRFVVKLKILDIFKGKKYNTACISDLQIIPNSYFELTDDEHGLLKISEPLIDTLFYNNEVIYQISEMSEDLKWIIFIEIPADLENSRIETLYKLYNTERESFIEFEKPLLNLFFENTDSGVFLDNGEELLPLNNL